MSNSQGAVALTHHPFELATFEHLAKFASKARTAFELNAIDRAFDRLIARPNRATSGNVLALRLVRDGRKFLRAHRRRETLSDDIEATNRSNNPPTAEELEDIRLAVLVIREGLRQLNDRDRQAFVVKAGDRPAQILNVQPRQFRNIVATARVRLRNLDGMDAAYLVVRDGLDRWRFETIELLSPLMACLALSSL